MPKFTRIILMLWDWYWPPKGARSRNSQRIVTPIKRGSIRRGVDFLCAKELSKEVRDLRREWATQEKELDYIRFPRFYRFLRWKVSDPGRDKKRAERLEIASFLVVLLIIIILETRHLAGEFSFDWGAWAFFWEWPLGAAFTLVVIILHWEPYRQAPALGDSELPITMVFYLIPGTIGMATLIFGSSAPIWPFVLTFFLAVAGLSCYRLGHLYERDLLRG